VTVNVELFDDLDSVARDAGGRLDRDAQPSLFDRLDWFRLLERHCPPAGKLVALRGRNGERSAWLFLAIDHPVARPYSAWYSLRFGPVGDAEGDLMTAMAAAVRDGGVAEVDLAPLEDAEPLRASFRAAGFLTFVAPKTGNWRADTEGLDFEAYWAKRPARLRNTAKRRAKSAGLEIEIFDRFEESAWAEYEAVYRASWKPEEGSFPFLRALAAQEGAAGTLRLGIARKDGRPVAAQLWLVENGEATIHKLAYAEEAKAMSPGTLLGMAMFRRALDVDRVRTIDYGTGDEPYKADWMDERRTLWRLTAYNPRTLRGLIGAARASASALVARRGSR
jgi:CelD/BcsL family acetyltransferase involved in cellulose biosynthesis